VSSLVYEIHTLRVAHLKLKVVSLALMVAVVILAALGVVLSSMALNKQKEKQLIVHEKITQEVAEDAIKETRVA
jgi:hypothetical protein